MPPEYSGCLTESFERVLSIERHSRSEAQSCEAAWSHRRRYGASRPWSNLEASLHQPMTSQL